jgi:hypothetical protein
MLAVGVWEKKYVKNLKDGVTFISIKQGFEPYNANI